jgi:hypothetical protein
MHLICNLINQPTTGASGANTHVLYAYSVDSGKTFKKIDGSSISALPMGPTSMTVVTSRTQADIIADCYIGAFDTNKPVVSWRSAGDGSRITYWNGTAWQFITPGGSSAGRKLYSRRNGETLFFGPEFNYLHRTFNKGVSFQRYNFNPKYLNGVSQPTASEVVDADYYLKTGNVRYQFSNATTEDSIYLTTIPFSPILPLNLLSFKANTVANAVNLTWVTANEINVSHFIVEKSNTLNSWESFNTIAAKGGVNNTNYVCVYANPAAKNFYRIKMVDKDGQYTYSNVINILYEKPLEALYYNSTTKSVVFKDHLLYQTKTKYRILNALGQTFKTDYATTNQISVANLPLGMYYLQLETGTRYSFLKF